MKTIHPCVFVLLFSTATAHAGFIQVTTTDDVVDAGSCASLTVAGIDGDPGPDGEISLREAVCAANNTPGEDLIDLNAGVFTLTIGSSGENAAAEGDLDILESVLIDGSGPANTIIENGIGLPGTLGDGDRVFEVGPGFMSGINLRLSELTVRNGDVGCTGIDCYTGAGGIHFESDGFLSLDLVDVVDNSTSCTGACCGNGDNTGGILMRHGGNLFFDEGNLSRNTASCNETGMPSCLDTEEGICKTGHAALAIECFFDDVICGALPATVVELDQVTIADNSAECTGHKCLSHEIINISILDSVGNSLQITDSVIEDNTNSCAGFDCNSSEMFENDSPGAKHLDNVIVRNNLLTCTGESCDTDELFSLNESGISATVLNSRFLNNDLNCNGFDCDTDELLELDNGDIQIVRNTVLADNQQTCMGDSCDTNELLSMKFTTASIIENTQILRNTHFCTGTDCNTDEIIEFGANEEITNAHDRIINTVVADNVASCSGTLCECDVAGVALVGEESDSIIRDTTITGNSSVGDDAQVDCQAQGTGGLWVASGKSTTVINTTISDNETSTSGAGIKNFGSLTLIHSTISDNRADVDGDGMGIGGGICNSEALMGGIGSCAVDEAEDATLIMNNTIFSGNTDGEGSPNCNGPITSGGFNIVSDDSGCTITGPFDEVDPELAPLADNGCDVPLPDGSCVPTHALSGTSPALDGGSCATSGEPRDARSRFRPFDMPGVTNVDDGCDIGAYEENSDHIFYGGYEY